MPDPSLSMPLPPHGANTPPDNDETDPAIHIPASFPDIPELDFGPEPPEGPDGPILPDLTSHAYAVHHARVKYATLKAELDALTAEFEEQNRILIEAVADARTRLNSTEEEARAAAVTVFEVTGVKKLEAGFGIRVATRYVYNEDDAKEWAIESKMPAALKLDKRGFEKLLKAGAADGRLVYEAIEEPGATIPSDLSAAVEEFKRIPF